MSYSIPSVFEKLFFYFKQLYTELLEELYTEDEFWEAISVPFLEDTPTGQLPMYIEGNLETNMAYDLM